MGEITAPFNLENERCVLGAILLRESNLDEYSTFLAPGDFYLDSNRTLFAMMQDMAAAGTPVDEATLVDRLLAHDKLASVGGIAYVSDLTRGKLANGLTYAKAVKEDSRRRQVMAICDAGRGRAANRATSVERSLSSIQEQLLEVSAEVVGKTVFTPKDLAPEVLADLDAQLAGKYEKGLATGVGLLDKMTLGGIRPGELWVFGALPGRGKTSFMVQAAVENARKDIPVAVFSLEMTRSQLLRRAYLAEASHIHGCRITAAKTRDPRDPQYGFHNTDLDDYQRIIDRSLEWPLYIDDTSSLTLSELLARARLYIRRFGCKLICVDYLRLVNTPGKELRERVAKTADGLRQLAKSTGVPVLALSQLSRPKDRDINAEPTMLDLKESGDVEAAAHVVLLAHLPIGKDGRPSQVDHLVIGKQREGVTGPVPVRYCRRSLTFVKRDPKAPNEGVPDPEVRWEGYRMDE